MGILLDTDVLIHAEKGALSLHEYIDHGDAYIAAVTLSELWVGVHMASSRERGKKRGEQLVRLLEGVAVLAFDEEIALLHAKIQASLRQNGCVIGAHDKLIAATAVHYELPLLTVNTREFSRVPELHVIEAKGSI